MIVLKIFDFFREHATARWTSLLALTLVLLASILRLSYKEDIQDFLPLSETDRQRMAVYQDISGMNRLFVIFENTSNAEETTEAIDCFVNVVEESDTAGWCQDLQATFDLESLSETIDFVYANAPLFLKEDDYCRMDSLLASPDFIDKKLEEDLNALMLPTGSLISENICRDPLGLFAPLLEELQQSQQQMRFELFDGYLFTPDMKMAIVMLSSPFGSSETDKNTQLVSFLDEAINSTQADFPKIKARVIGGPQVAVGNAKQILYDSILAISLAAILILALLLYAFRRFKDIVLIALSVIWGWLFALGGMAFVHDSVSMIVIGISSIIIGIAVNYPLHLTSHVQHQPNIRQALSEITTPLLVGNITTVGAFLALVPLKSIALRDLGLFASFLLIGTILFVLVWLPHFLTSANKRQQTTEKADFLSRLASIQIDRKRWVVVTVVLLTFVFGFYSLSVKFDSDVSNINYMTETQKEDMAYFQKLFDGDNSKDYVTLYLLSSGSNYNEALTRSESRQTAVDSLTEAGMIISHQGVSRFLPSLEEQENRMQHWNEWLKRHPQLLNDLNATATKHDFTEDAFADFTDIIRLKQTAKPYDDFQPLTSHAFARNVSQAIEGKATIAEVLTIKREHAKKVKETLPEAFDIASLHSSVADALSNDFNYIGWACSLIVFFFLWLSFRRIELAIISFIPMAISWLWILGIMSLLGIKFNIVNIILATFIFGQGDDYTIFMTEGCISEYIHKKPILTSYKRSIILSALIMFIGIGTLIFAQHPALHSLAEVTIIGMFSVVLMAYLIPPLLFKWMMKRFPKRFKTL